MKNKYLALALTFFSLCVFALLLSYPVLAQTATPYPTATAYPTFLPTETAQVYTFPTNFSCPEGGTPIAGYGTVTPSSLWALSCGQCVVTPYVTSTAIPMSTITGTPPTPTSIPSATATPLPILTCGTQGAGVSCSQTGDNTITVSAGISGVDYAWYDQAISAVVHLSQDIPVYFHVMVAGASVGGDAQLYPTWTTRMGFQGVDDGAFNTNIFTGVYSCYWYCNGRSSFDGYSSQLVGWTSARDYYFIMSGNAGISPYAWHTNWSDWSIVFSASPLNATPTPTPASSYCQSVEGVEAGEAETDPSLSWGGVKYGVNLCLNIGGWSVTLFGEDYTVPLIRFCVQDVSFVNVVLFGVSVSIDKILYVLFGAWVVRTIRSK